ncbi:hypothetical protein [Prosthecobacter sp.]|uniref:hypothetical protein n=1 Tax=Prosthecobacter sp. TaxID=1965333 RepID=UPI003784342C
MINRPLKRKLANAVLAWLNARKEGTSYAEITLVTGASTTLEQEAAADAGADVGPVTEPEPPYIAVEVITQADPDLPGVCSFELVLHLKTLAAVEDDEGKPSSRFDADAILRDCYNVLMAPLNDSAPFDDSNLECSAFQAFVNKPEGTDARENFRKPLHLYRMWHTTAPSLFDTDTWHDQIIFAGHAQDMDSH